MAFSLIPPGIDLCAIPAGVPPDGQLPNLVNPPSLMTTTIVVGVLMTVWALTFVVVRIIVNRRKLSWSDCKLTNSRPVQAQIHSELHLMILESVANKVRLNGSRHISGHSIYGSHHS